MKNIRYTGSINLSKDGNDLTNPKSSGTIGSFLNLIFKKFDNDKTIVIKIDISKLMLSLLSKERRVMLIRKIKKALNKKSGIAIKNLES